MNEPAGDPTRIDSVLGRVLRSLDGGRSRPTEGANGPSTTAALGGLFGRWAEIVGPDVARQVEPIRLDGDRLVVQVREPAWATQVRLLSDMLTTRILEVVGVRVTQLDVRVAGASSNGRRSERPASGSATGPGKGPASRISDTPPW